MSDSHHRQDIFNIFSNTMDPNTKVLPPGIEALLSRCGPELMDRVGVDDTFLSHYIDPGRYVLPLGADEYLSPFNPRLLELRRQYARSNSPALKYSVWNPEYVRSEVPLHRFRGDCAFVWQERDMNIPSTYLLTYYYLRATGHAELLDRLPEDDLFGVYTLNVNGSLISRDRLDSAVEIAFLDRVLGISKHRSYHILDVGSGYGRLALRLLQAFDNVFVTCVDAVPESTFLCEYYLRFRGLSERAQVISLPDIEAVLAERPIDAAVNVHSFSECPLSAIRWWLKLLNREQVPRILVVPNAGTDNGSHLLSRETDNAKIDFLPLFDEFSYKLLLMEPKYTEPALQQLGISPTHHFLFGL